VTDVSEEHVAAVKTEANCSSETSVDFQRITRRHVPEDESLRNRRYENLKPKADAIELRADSAAESAKTSPCVISNC
jgi:hypothetical protein